MWMWWNPLWRHAHCTRYGTHRQQASSDSETDDSWVYTSYHKEWRECDSVTSTGTHDFWHKTLTLLHIKVTVARTSAFGKGCSLTERLPQFHHSYHTLWICTSFCVRGICDVCIIYWYIPGYQTSHGHTEGLLQGHVNHLIHCEGWAPSRGKGGR